MRKIRLTESQLIDLIKKSVNKVKTINESRIINEVTTISAESLAQIAKNLKANMGGEGISDDVQVKHLKAAYTNISAMKDWVWEDGTCAVDKLLAYYKTYNGGTDFLTSLKGATESNDPEFDDLKAKLPKLITQLQQSCAAAKKKDVDDASAKAVALSSCASKEPGFSDIGNGSWTIKPFGKGWINGYNSGNSTADGYNVWYSYDDKKTNTTKQTQKTKGSCINGVLNLVAWVKI